MSSFAYDETPGNLSNSTEAWLNSYSPTPPKPKKPIRKVLLFVGLVFLILCLVLCIIFAINKSKPCLTLVDFTNLTGVSLDGELNPKDNFYTTNIKFVNKSTDYAQGLNNTITVGKIISFYEQHKDKSIAISLKGYYPKNTSDVITRKRIDKIHNDFIQANIPPANLAVGVPTAYEPDSDEINAVGNASIKSITISSKQIYHQLTLQ